MRLAAIAFTAAAGLVLAGSADASGRVTDMDFLKANRCKGIAAGMGADTAGIDAFIKAERRARPDIILEHGAEEAARGKRQAADANLKERLTAELASTCTAYMGPGKTVAGQ